ncbi:MAG: SIS domain-containing protein, partial [Desulfobacterales bacterium]|nr:SIS domain-containing protein [Desulfobacterales bacterium]
MISRIQNAVSRLFHAIPSHICMGLSPAQAPEKSLIIFPHRPNTLCCGICALVAIKGKQGHGPTDLRCFHTGLDSLEKSLLNQLDSSQDLEGRFLGGDALLETLFHQTQELKQEHVFQELFTDAAKTYELTQASQRFNQLVETAAGEFQDAEETLSTKEVEILAQRLEKLRDIAWALDREILANVTAIQQLGLSPEMEESQALAVFKRINAVLNSIDRLEVRGRDSAGISVLFTLAPETFESFRQELGKSGLSKTLKARTNPMILANNGISIQEGLPHADGIPCIGLAFTYKFAAEIGALGDNVAFLRSQVKNDHILHLLTRFPHISASVSAHTRWASVGDITEANCHPVDNTPTDPKIKKSGILHVCLNGDIDNYLELKTEYEAHYDKIHTDINTDTKLIPLQIEHHLKHGADIEEAFRLAVNDFSGSHAISLHSDLAPGKVFLAQKGSGQAIFVGIAPDHYIAASELYGVVEETQHYIKLNGEDKGQIVVLDQNAPGGVEGIRSYYYNGETISMDQDQVLTSQITSRDIDRQGFPHYFLKEISESPDSVDKTLENKFKRNGETGLFEIKLPEETVPNTIIQELITGKISKVYFIGQGTAGIAAQGCADMLTHYLGETQLQIRALKSSELSGFSLDTDSRGNAMENTLVVAISQSGTTTDTNRTVDMAKACGARTLAIVNRRESDLTFKTDGVLYTSSGRDIEMSVASTKAFYSQLTAGAVLGLYIAAVTQTRSPEYIAQEIGELIALPEKMKATLALKDEIKASADTAAVTKNYWATVGSGANKTASDEIRIKLSELCYKTISSDFVEDKKHIDLSSEPLIIICAAGTRESVLGDIIKDTAIFHAHKATPIVITTQGEDRFDTYSDHIFKIPHIPEHFAPLLNTLVGHLWGYYAALAINRGSSFFYKFRTEIQELLEEYMAQGQDEYEILLEKRFREKVALYYNKFSQKRREDGFPAAMGLDNAANITLLLKYLSGRLP